MNTCTTTSSHLQYYVNKDKNGTKESFKTNNGIAGSYLYIFYYNWILHISSKSALKNNKQIANRIIKRP